MELKYIHEGMSFPMLHEMFMRVKKEFLIPRFVTFNTEDRNGVLINHVMYKNEHKFSFIAINNTIKKIIK